MLAERQDITVVCNLEETEIVADEGQMYQLVHNLVSNAVKYNRPGGRVDIELLKKGDKIMFKVADTGIGIPPEHLDKIFERFYVVDKSRNKKISSSGLGLSIVKHIVKAHDGQITVKSAEGKGTEFTVVFPQNA